MRTLATVMRCRARAWCVGTGPVGMIAIGELSPNALEVGWREFVGELQFASDGSLDVR